MPDRLNPEVGLMMRREAAPHTPHGGCMMQLLAGGRCFPASAGRRTVDHAKQRSDRELAADLEPRVELLPGPTVHPDLAPFAAFPRRTSTAPRLLSRSLS